jgi:outer membrane biosynthesis protein TonB
MTKNLEEVLDEGYLAYQREAAIKNLGERTHLTLGQISKLCEHPKHGTVVASITLDDLIAKKLGDAEDEEPDPDPDPPRAAKKSAKKAATKKKAAAPAQKKSAPPKKKATKTSAPKKATSAPKADKGKPKPRLDYETGMKEVLAALKAARGPQGRSAIEQATGYTGVQVRAFCQRLVKAGKINILGEGGRSTQYEAT